MKKFFLPLMASITLFSCKENKDEKVTEKVNKEAVAPNVNISDWMNWEGGVDVVGVTDKNMKSPNVIFHVARMVNTPVGSAPSGMILYRPDTTKAPIIMGFVSTNKTVGEYFGPKIFAGTPFEKAPFLSASFDIKNDSVSAAAKVTVGGHIFEALFTQLDKPNLISRAFGKPMPFHQQGVERNVAKVNLKVDGKEVILFVPPVGLAGGSGAVFSPNGIYAR